MHNHNITAPQRVLYVSGMLLSMQEIKGKKGGLKPSDLKGEITDTSRDGVLVFNQISEFLKTKNLSEEKRDLMLASFKEISKDPQRDKETSLDKAISMLLEKDSSITKQIFTFLYEFVHKPINESDNTGHLDIMGELYSEFLKYALGDGKELGIVLTPPYVTKMMSELLRVNAKSFVMDLAAGSAGFLISSMVLMIEDIEKTYGKNTTKANEKIKDAKTTQLLGVELNAEMFSLATTNMILRGDGSSLIIKGNTFETNKKIYEDFKPNILLLNPPFSYEENGMPFIKFGLEYMQKGGLGAIIIQDSAGSGQALKSNVEILKKHSLLASIKMPTDLFMPQAGVQTSVYIFKAHEPHDYEKPVKFIDFRNDGFKRTKRGLNETSNPTKRYEEIIKIYKAGLNAQVSKELWGDLETIYIEDFIAKPHENKHAKDFNFEAHQKNDTKPELPALTAGILNQGLNNFVPKENATILKNVISISANGANTGATFYQPHEFCVLQDAYAIEFIGDKKLNDKEYLFFVCAISKVIYNNSKYEWTNKAGWNKVKNELISLPLKPTAKTQTLDDIDFHFMETFIAELEQCRLAELQAYLKATGLENTTLSSDEENALNVFNNSGGGG